MQEPIPEGKAAAGAAGAASTGGGDGGSLFIPSPTAGNIHTAEIPQRKRNLVQTLPSAGTVQPGLKHAAPWSARFPIHSLSIQAQGYSFRAAQMWMGQIISAGLDVESVYGDYWGKAIEH